MNLNGNTIVITTDNNGAQWAGTAHDAVRYALDDADNNYTFCELATFEGLLHDDENDEYSVIDPMLEHMDLDDLRAVLGEDVEVPNRDIVLHHKHNRVEPLDHYTADMDDDGRRYVQANIDDAWENKRNAAYIPGDDVTVFLPQVR